MYIVHVHIHVKPEHLDAFIAATMENARGSSEEPGVLRFDFLQQADDPTRFTLVEVYDSEADVVKHRETPHYLIWRDTAAPMMAGERTRVLYNALYPTDVADWE
jgi:quinol monooxygenase YgiN